MSQSPLRITVAALTLSAAGFIGIVGSEGYTDTAVIPVRGDRPTVGFGSTFKEGGAAVKLGDKTTPVRALILASAATERTQQELRACIGGVPMYQREWDAVVSWAYNVGTGAACKSTLVKKLKAQDYVGACNELMRWTFVAGRQVPGLVKRREAERDRCLGAIQ